MCNFISWVEHDNKNYFLTNADLDTKQGRKLLTDGYKDDIEGHGAIMHYYPELKGKGVHQECEDFSTPSNFPKEVVKEFMKGNMTRIGITPDVFNKKGKAEYLKIEQSAYAKYDEITQPARSEYDKIRQSAWAEYLKIKQRTLVECDKITKNAYAEYLKIHQPAYAEYQRKCRQIFTTLISQRKYVKKEWRNNVI